MAIGSSLIYHTMWGSSSLAKLVYKFNKLGLWWLYHVISIVLWFIYQLTTGGAPSAVGLLSHDQNRYPYTH